MNFESNKRLDTKSAKTLEHIGMYLFQPGMREHHRLKMQIWRQNLSAIYSKILSADTCDDVILCNRNVIFTSVVQEHNNLFLYLFFFVFKKRPASISCLRDSSIIK